jgi:hypothetical protein
MDPFAQQVQRIENNDKVKEIVEALRLIPIADNDVKTQINASLEKILTPAAHKIPETQKKITEFEFTEPEFSYHDIAERQKYRPMKHGIHYLDEDSTLYYNSEIEASAWEDENVVATTARDEATAAAENAAAIQAAYNNALTRQQGINTRIFAQPPRWVLIKRKALNDTRMEDSLLQYIDKKHTQVDWYSTITTLHKTGSKIGYTLDHYRRVLHRFISYFKPEMNQLGQKMGLDELARLLMTSTMPVNDREMVIHEIKKLTRRKTESLRVPMSNLYSLATTYYNDDPDAESQRNKLLFNGLQHFTTGVTKEKLTRLIKYSQLQKIKLDYHDTLETCILSEKTNGEPAEDLQFGQSKETILVFQANITPVDSLLDNDITPIEFTLANPSKKKDGKYEDSTKPKKPDERQPHIHAVKTKIQTIPHQRQNEDTESEASTSRHSSRRPSRESSRHESSPDRSRQSSTERPKTPPPPPAEETPSSSRRSRSKQRSGPKQRRHRSTSQSSKSPSRQLEVELSTAPKKKQGVKKWLQTEKPARKSERINNKLYQITTLVNEIKAEKTPTNSKNNSRESSYSRDSSDRRRNQDRDRKTSSDRQSRADSRDRPRPRDRSSSRDRTNYKSSRDRSSRSRSRESYRSSRSNRDRSTSRTRSPYSDRYSTTSSRSRYRSSSRDRYSRDRTPTNYRTSRDSYNYRPESRSSNYSRSTRDRSLSRDRYSDRSRRSYSRDRDSNRRQRSRTPDRQSSRRSQSPYQNKTVIPGLNCSPSYKPGSRFCKKCTNDGHEEPDCRQYYHWAPQKCTICNGGFHFRDQCKLNNTKRSDSPGRPKNY